MESLVTYSSVDYKCLTFMFDKILGSPIFGIMLEHKRK